MADRRTRIEDGLLVAALAVAFWPVFSDLVGHWCENSWSRYSLSFVPLSIWCLWNERGAVPRVRIGIASIAVAVLVEVASALASMITAARPALPLALAGYLLLRGRAHPRTAALVFFIVPVPFVVLRLGGGEALTRLQFQVAAGLLSPFGLDFRLERRAIWLGNQSLPFIPEWCGAVVVLFAVGLAWYWGVRTAASPLATAMRMLQWAAGAALIQVATVPLALLVMARVDAASAAGLLHNGPWLLALATAVWLTERAGRQPGLARQ